MSQFFEVLSISLSLQAIARKHQRKCHDYDVETRLGASL
ncbi:hypothetical protein MC7420_5249 [Coleofasciculus chthonoplastes PCC 7420]|uniref:Uncharacterized protein n=1 Tax=Coleofasciculus chthonoplastes PCC 7420 TaxID=118168 RepID=B4W2J8_9CYAN|nr:hypothetical protein MC7420_5249 [Coleofasciculus chthonoplastes PCC 7420]